MSIGDSYSGPVMFNPFESGYHDDPYAQYALLREHEPVHHTVIGPWLFTRYDHVEALMRDPNLSVAFENAQAEQLPDAVQQSAARAASGDDGPPASVSYSYPQIIRQLGLRDRVLVLHSLDGPEHTRLRRTIANVFTPAMLEELRPRVQTIVDEQLDGVSADGGMDVIRDLAFPLPVRVISDMLGMPEADRERLSKWSHLLAATLDPILSPEQIRDAYEATKLMVSYMEIAIAERRRRPTDDLLSALIGARDEGVPLTDEEILDNAIFLYASGHETTVNLIGNGLVALLDHPQQLAQLREDPALAANAVEEFLRYDSPVQFTRRITTSEFTIEGQTIPSGSIVLICLGAANRDPDYWGPTAQELDVRRENARKHVSFGRGVHNCLGAALSRMEAQVALASVVRRFPDMAVADEPLRNNRIVLRGFDTVTVTF